MNQSVFFTLCVTLSLFTWNLTQASDRKPITNPQMKMDYTIVVKNHSLVFDVLENEIEDEVIVDFGLVTKPQYGVVSINEDQTFTYAPEKDFCDEIDEFQYFYKHKNGVDTVNVMIEILCESITVINGFSPTSEEEEDINKFTILGIENYPDNTLYIFNEKGNEVYYKEGYSNDWEGHSFGTPLPSDYVYYFVFSDGLGNTFSGYVNIE